MYCNDLIKRRARSLKWSVEDDEATSSMECHNIRNIILKIIIMGSGEINFW